MDLFWLNYLWARTSCKYYCCEIMKDYIVNIQQCTFIYIHSEPYWMGIGTLPKVPRLSAPLPLTVSPSLIGVFAEGAKLCGV